MKRRSKYFAALMMFLAPVAYAQEVDQESGGETREDLLTVIHLSGFACGSIADFSMSASSEYQTTCSNGEQYLISIAEENEVRVNRLAGGQSKETETDFHHDEFMKNQLSSIVNLSGYDCTEVVDYERPDSRNNIVTCEDQAMYRISVKPDGHVAVHEHPTDK